MLRHTKQQTRHDRQEPVPGGSSPSDSDSTTRRLFDLGLLSIVSI